MVFFRELGDDGLALLDPGAPLFPGIAVLAAYTQGKRLAKHEAKLRIRGEGVGDQLVVNLRIARADESFSGRLKDRQNSFQIIWTFQRGSRFMPRTVSG